MISYLSYSVLIDPVVDHLIEAKFLYGYLGALYFYSQSV